MFDYSKLFIKDSDHNEVFYPWSLGKGYIIQQAEKKDEILNVMQGVSKIFILTFIVFLLTVLVQNYLSLLYVFALWMVLLFALIYVYYELKLYPILRSEKKSPHSVSIVDYCRIQICIMPAHYYWIFSIFVFWVCWQTKSLDLVMLGSGAVSIVLGVIRARID